MWAAMYKVICGLVAPENPIELEYNAIVKSEKLCCLSLSNVLSLMLGSDNLENLWQLMWHKFIHVLIFNEALLSVKSGLLISQQYFQRLDVKSY